MGRSRIRASELIKLLNSSEQPIYAIDEEQRLVFCNQACHQWVGCDPNELLGLRCTYRSSTEVAGAEAVAAALCPPQDVIGGQRTRGTICCADRTGRLACRQAHFVRIEGDEGEAIGVLVLLAGQDLPQAKQSTPDESQSEADWLHQRIQRFRHEAAGAFRLERLLGDSPAMRRARAQVGLAAQSSAAVLIIGPPGSGRQHVARTIHHAAAAHSEANLIPLACSVLGAELIGSAVRAVAERRLEGGALGRGTLLLGDIDVLPREAHSEVASALAAHSFPFRIIGTARRSLEELARGGRYHRDLAALLSTVEICLPPLADRREDLPLLSQGFLEEINGRSTKQVAGFTPQALDWLDSYDWPGNVDELAHVVNQAHRQAEGPLVEVRDLPQQIHLARKAAAHPRRSEERIVLDDFLARIERELIERAMAEARGNKTKTAELLGLTRPRLYRRLVQLGLEKDDSQDRGRRVEEGE
jgi:DNA-binding NtrC family response regulator